MEEINVLPNEIKLDLTQKLIDNSEPGSRRQWLFANGARVALDLCEEDEVIVDYDCYNDCGWLRIYLEAGDFGKYRIDEDDYHYMIDFDSQDGMDIDPRKVLIRRDFLY